MVAGLRERIMGRIVMFSTLVRHRVAQIVLTVGLLAVLTPPPLRASECCLGDLGSQDGTVNAADLALLLGSWGPCAGCAADLNEDGTVGPNDLALLLGNWGSCVFDYDAPYANGEAEQIGLELLGPAGPLLLPVETYDRIDRDLELIHNFEPALASETHTPAWIPNEMIIGWNPGASQQEYDCLNEFYQVTDIEVISASLQLYLLTFPGDLNIEALAVSYDEAPAVNYAEPNGLIGGQNFWTPTPQANGLWRWDVDDGFLDCFDGCDCHRLYTFRTDLPGNVQLVSYEEFGQPWCKF